jgi:two-component system sensor histidine kinase KdpD
MASHGSVASALESGPSHQAKERKFASLASAGEAWLSPSSGSVWRQYLLALGVFAGTSLLNLWLEPWIGYAANALVYLMAVVMLARFVSRGPLLFGTTLTALGWTYLFCPPRFSFSISDAYDKMMLGTYFAVALMVGQVTARLRAERQLEHLREKSSTALYLLASEMGEVVDQADFLKKAAEKASEVFEARVTFLLPVPGAGLSLAGPDSDWCQDELESRTALWAFQNNKPAGRGTDRLLHAEGSYLPLSAGSAPAGIMASKGSGLINSNEVQIQRNFARQITLLLDRHRLRQAEVQTRLLAESERLGRTLLNSVSHELRTPIAAIASAVSSIQTSGGLNPTQGHLAEEIETAAARLNRVVQNLLSAARLQSGQLRPKLDWCDVDELVRVTLRNVGGLLAGHPVKVQLQPGLPLVKADFGLMEQVLTNLLVNAGLHTPDGTPIELAARVEGQQLRLEVADRGPGLPPELVERVFDPFQRTPAAKPGGTGLGLTIVKGFIEAQGGHVSAANRAGGGVVFGICFPLTDPPKLREEVREC